MDSDIALLRRFVAAGDAQAFSEIVHRHAGLVYGACLRVLADKDKAADVAQETFLQLLQNAGRITGSVPSWLHRVATRKAINMVHKDSSQRKRDAEYASEKSFQTSRWEDISTSIDQGLDELDDETREILIRYFFEGHTTVDIASDKGISQPTVSRRIEEGVGQLRQKLGKRGITVAPAALGSLLAQNAAEATPAIVLEELGKIALAGATAASGVGGAGAVSGPAAKAAAAAAMTGVKAKIITAVALAAVGVGGVVAYMYATRPIEQPEWREPVAEPVARSRQSPRPESDLRRPEPAERTGTVWAPAIAGPVYGEVSKKESESSPPASIVKLDGREVVARLYPDSWQDPEGYETVPLVVEDRKVSFDFDGLDYRAFVAVFAEDQNDQTIKQLIGDRVFGWPYRKELEFSLPIRASKAREHRWNFFDALGNPLPNANVEMYLKCKNHKILLTRVVLDEKGQLQTLYYGCEGRCCEGPGGTRYPLFVISHPTYGVAEVILWGVSGKQEHDVVLPFVPPDSEAYARCVWGVVLDPNGNPVAGALVEPTKLVTPDWDMIRSWRGGRCWVRTDEKGRFRAYLPVDVEDEKMGVLIPPKTRCGIWITPQDPRNLLMHRGFLPNGQDNVVTLERPALYFRTFIFETQAGPTTDAALLPQVALRIVRRGRPDIWLGYEDFKDGGMFPLGTFEPICFAETDYEFEPIDVTADSPEQLTFKTPTGKVYSGRVVHGVTGEPMAGAFVIDSDHTRGKYKRNLSMLTDHQWRALRTLPTYALYTNEEFAEALEPVCYSFSRIVRTDANGCFELPVPKPRDFDKIATFQKDYLTVLTDRRRFKLNENERLEVPLIKLYPAATVYIEPWTQPLDRRVPQLPVECVIDRKDNPAWVQDFLAAWEPARFMDGIRDDYILQLNQRNSFYIPAGLYMQIRIFTWNREAERWALPVLADSAILQQGQTLDLGSWQIRQAAAVLAEVLNSAGEPIEGVPVKAVGKYYTKSSYTDEDGIALFYVAPDSTGEFVVENKQSDEPGSLHLREAIPYSVAGPEDANTVYTLQISDEMLEALFE